MLNIPASRIGVGMAEISDMSKKANAIPVEKNQSYEVQIHAMSSEGNGIAQIDGYTLFVPQTAAGDMVRVQVLKVKSSYGYAKVLEILKPSDARQMPFCQVFEKCGGCTLQHLQYPFQLAAKKQFIEDALQRIGGFSDLHADEMIGMEHPYRYRNKMVFPIGWRNGQITAGFYRERSHDLIPLSDCSLGDSENQKILRAVISYMEENRISPYDETSHTGCVRRVFIRQSRHFEERMAVISANCKKPLYPDRLTEAIQKACPSVCSIYWNQNCEKNNLVLGKNNILLAGKPTIRDRLCGLEYEISPHSFFQVNPEQTERLYQKALEDAEISSGDTVLDVYCGIGTISLAAAKRAGRVIGVEIVPQAIEDAKKNAEKNGIFNAEFYAADAQSLVPKLIREGICPDVVVLDPPRKGSDPETLSAILSAAPKRIVYVSCNPATLARDLKLLSGHYQIQNVTGVDMFPWTSHVETIALLQNRNM